MASSLTRLFVFYLSTFCALTLAAQEASQGPPSPGLNQKGNCKLEGSVVSAVGGTPVRKANVIVVSDDSGRQEQRDTTTTDSQGQFSFTELLPGKYRLFATHPSHVPPFRVTRNSVLTYTLSSGQEIKDAVIRITPGAVLRGRVTDEDGDPVLQSQVELISASRKGRYGGMMNRIPFAGSGMTNDLGEFRLFGVPLGRYYIKANPGSAFGFQMPQSKKAQQSVYISTFYPSATSREAAAVLDIHGGEEMVLNIALQRIVVYPVSGILTSAKGSVENGMVTAMQGMSQVGVAGVENGKFELRLPTGHYTLIGVGQDAQMVTMDGESGSQAHKVIDVSEGGLRNVELVLATDKGQSVQVSGRVRVEGGASIPKEKTLFLTLRPMGAWMAQQEDDDSDLRWQNQAAGGQSKSDGTFEIKNVRPGTYELTIASSSSGMEDWYTKAVNVGAHDMLNSGIPVSNSDLELDVVLSSKGASVEGTAKDNEQHPATAATVVLVPDSARAKRLELYQTANSDQTGHFVIRGVEPGSYTACAFEEDQAGVWFSPEGLKQYKDDGVPISVRAAEKSHAELHLATNHQQQETQ